MVYLSNSGRSSSHNKSVQNIISLLYVRIGCEEFLKIVLFCSLQTCQHKLLSLIALALQISYQPESYPAQTLCQTDVSLFRLNSGTFSIAQARKIWSMVAACMVFIQDTNACMFPPILWPVTFAVSRIAFLEANH